MRHLLRARDGEAAPGREALWSAGLRAPLLPCLHPRVALPYGRRGRPGQCELAVPVWWGHMQGTGRPELLMCNVLCHGGHGA